MSKLKLRAKRRRAKRDETLKEGNFGRTAGAGAGSIGGGLAGSTIGGLAGGAAGSAFGPLGTPVGSALGKLVGGSVGAAAGGLAGGAAGDAATDILPGNRDSMDLDEEDIAKLREALSALEKYLKSQHVVLGIAKK